VAFQPAAGQETSINRCLRLTAFKQKTIVKRIQVSPGASEISYPSLQEAISAASRGIRQTAAQATTAQIRGLMIKSISWTKKSLHFVLSDGNTLEFFLSPENVDWKLTQGHELPRPTDEDSSPQLLCFSNGTESVWDPAEVLRPRTNKKILGIFASTAWVFLYAENCRTLLLANLLIEGQDSGLYWSDTD
jgi:hypothetical protein